MYTIVAASESVRAIRSGRLDLLFHWNIAKRCPGDVPPCDGSPSSHPGQGMCPERRDNRQGETIIALY